MIGSISGSDRSQSNCFITAVNKQQLSSMYPGSLKVFCVSLHGYPRMCRTKTRIKITESRNRYDPCLPLMTEKNVQKWPRNTRKVFKYILSNILEWMLLIVSVDQYLIKRHNYRKYRLYSIILLSQSMKALFQAFIHWGSGR